DTACALPKISYGKIMFIDSGATEKTDYKKCYSYAIAKRNDYDFLMSQYESFRGLILHGLFASFFPNGVMKDSGLVIYDKKNGKWIERFNNGKIHSITNWKNGVENGEQTYYWKNGNKHLEYFVKKDKKDGIEESYYENGNRESVINWKNGRIEKPYYDYWDDGSKCLYHCIYNGIKNGIDTIFNTGHCGINSLTYYDNDEETLYRFFFWGYNKKLNNDYEVDETIKNFSKYSKDTLTTIIRIKVLNGNQTKYGVNSKTLEGELIDDGSNLYREDFQILLDAIEYNKKNCKSKRD
ncbi:MAG: hypothetical protein WBM07_05525, partial [Chitinivibrionales bacterium]